MGDLEFLEAWLGQGRSDVPPEEAFRSFARDAGVELPREIIADGRIHRFGTNGARDDAGWYVFHNDGLPAGAIGDWRTGTNLSWTGERGHLSPEELEQLQIRTEAIQRMREAERARVRAAVAETCQAIWDAAPPAPEDHPYLVKKGIMSHGARVAPDGRLMVPLMTTDGTVSSLQYIAPTSVKRYHKDGAVAGTFWWLGDPNGATRLYICEGFATAATVHEVTGSPVLIAYSASGIVQIVGMAREWFTGDLCIVADNDPSGVGQRYAEQAAAKHGARYVIGSPNPGEDANDYAAGGGDLLGLLQPRRSGWLVPVAEFCRQPAPIRWLVKGWLQREGLTTLIGPSGSGKSFLAIDWCLRIASGLESWAGHKVRSGAVVYLAGEGHHGMRSRIAAWRARRELEGAPTDPRMWVSESGTDLDTPAGYLQAREAIIGLPESPALIVVDTLHRFLRGDENLATDIKKLVDSCSRLQAEFGCAILIVHHTGVSEEAQRRARGSSALRGSLDGEVLIVPEAHGHRVECTKSKDSAQPRPLSASLSPQVVPGWLDEDGEQVSSAVWQEEQDIIDAIVQGDLRERADRAMLACFAGVGETWVSDEDAISTLTEHGLTRSALDAVSVAVAHRSGAGWRKT